MKKIIAVITLLFLGAMFASAQTNLPFLVSKAALRTYACEQVRMAASYPSCSSMLQSTPSQIAWNTNRSSADILSFFTGIQAPIKILNPLDWVFESAALYNSDGEVLIYGWGYSLPATNSSGQYYLPPMQIGLELNNPLPIKFDHSVASAQFMETDPEYGYTTSIMYLDAVGNKVYFNPDLAGQGYLTVNFKDGTSRSYDLRHGGGQTTGVPLTITVGSARIDNHFTFNNPDSSGQDLTITDVIQTWDGGVGNNHSYEVVSTIKGYIAINVKTSDGYPATGYRFRQAGAGTGWTYVPAAAPSTMIGIVQGIWYIYPEWDPSQFREYVPNGEGKG